MNTTRFNEVVTEFLNATETTLIKKQAEYSLTEDRLKFFKRQGAIEGCKPTIALSHCLAKHITSFIDMVQSGDKFSKQLWFDKLGDITNYMILLYALLEDTDMYLDTAQATELKKGKTPLVEDVSSQDK